MFGSESCPVQTRAPIAHGCTFIRQMRGHSHSSLVMAENGHTYVLKAVANPQGTKSLWNEWFAHRLLARVGVATPPIDCLRFTDSHCKIPGPHFGVRLPVDPSKQAIYDFLPSKLYDRVENRDDFVRLLVFDCWLGQNDRRQAVFARNCKANFFAWFIDHGELSLRRVLEGEANFTYFDRNIYPARQRLVSLVDDSLSRLDGVTDTDLYNATLGAPSVWLEASETVETSRWIEFLIRRKKTLREDVELVLARQKII